MRSRLLNGVLWSCITVLCAQDVRTEAGKDFGLGRAMGSCLLQPPDLAGKLQEPRCRVIRGFIVADSAKPGQSIPVQVSEQLYGIRLDQSIVELPYGDPTVMRTLGESPNRAWRGVSIVKNVPIMAAIATERIADVKPGEPIVVTSNEQGFEMIRSLVQEALRLREFPENISADVASLSGSRHSAMAGFLFVYLTLEDHVFHPERASMLLLEMLEKPSVPPGWWDEMAQLARANYYRLSRPDRGKLVTRFVTLAQSSDSRKALTAFRQIDQIAGADESVWAVVDASVKAELAKTYHALVDRGSIPRSRSFESGFLIQ
jgi:hypothetical protein